MTDVDRNQNGPAEADPLGIVVVEPYPVILAGLVRTIDASEGLEVLATAASAEEALAAVGGVRAHRVLANRVLVLIAMSLAGDQDAFWLIRAMRERFPGHVIVGLGANADPQLVSRALFVGADGFVDKNIAVDEFLSALRSAGEHEVVIAGPAADSVGEIAEGIDRRRTSGFRLTRREREVLAIAAEGLTAREIAERLGVRERTVTTHLARIYGKLGVGNRLAALRLAARAGLVSIGPPD
jgi:DNA-binding NarL/FixJ family response regulator